MLPPDLHHLPVSYHDIKVNTFTYICGDVDSSGYCTPEILRRIGLASSIMSQLDRVWRQSRLKILLSFTSTIRVSCHQCYMPLKHGHH